MSVTQGMNVQEVQALGQALKTNADQLRRLVGNVDRVTSISSWAGPDSVRFKTQVWPQHRGGVLRVASGLEEIGNIAFRNASEQLRASDAGGMASPFGVTVGALGGIAGVVAGHGFQQFISTFGGSGVSPQGATGSIIDVLGDGLELGERWADFAGGEIAGGVLKAEGYLQAGGALSLVGGAATLVTSGYDLFFDQRTDDLAWVESSADGLMMASGALGIVGGAFLLASNPVGWTIAGVGTVVAVGALAVDTGLFIYDNWDEIVEFGEDVGEFVLDAADVVNTHVVQPLIEVGATAIDAAIDVGGAIVDGAANVGGAVVDGLADVGGAVVDGLADVGGAVWDGLTGWF